MSLINKTIYPFVSDDISKQILEQYFTVTEDEINFANNNTKYLKTFLCFLISLKFFKHTGYFVNISKCSTSIINYITETNQYDPLTQDDIDVYDMSKQSRRHQQIILEHLNIKPYDKKYTIKLAKNIAKVKDTQIDIINCIIEELLRKKYELPQFGELEIIAQQIKIKINYSYYQSIYSNLTPKYIKMINNEILIRMGSKSPWNNLKIEPEKPTLNNLRKFLQHYSWLKTIDLDNKVFKDIPLVKLDRFYEEALPLDLFRIKRMKKIKRIALVVVVIRKTASLALNDLGKMLIKVLRETETLAKHKLQLYKTGQLECTDELVNILKNILETYKTEPNNKKRSEAIDCLIADNLDYLLEKCDEYDAYAKKDHLPFMQQRFDRFRKELLLCLGNMQLRSSSKDKSIERVISIVLRHANSNVDVIAVNEFIEDNLTLSWIPLKGRQFITQSKDYVFKKRLELFLFVKIASQLATRDLFIVGSNKFIDYTNILISCKQYKKTIKEYGKIIDKPTTSGVFVKYLKQQLNTTCEQADLAFNSGINAKIKEGKVFLEKIVAKPLPKDFEAIDEKLNEAIPPVTLLNIIAHVAQSLHFEDFIKLKSDYDSKLSKGLEHIIAALFCYGCNIRQMYFPCN